MESHRNKDLYAYLDQDELTIKKFKSKTVIRFFKLLFQYPKPLLTGLGLIGLGTTASLLEPRILGYAIDDAIVPKNWTLLKIIATLFFVATTVRNLCASKQGYYFEKLGQSLTEGLRADLYAHLQKLSVSSFQKYPPGRLITRVTNDIAGLNEMFSAGFVNIIANFLLVIGILTWLMTLDLRLGLIAASVFPVLIIFSVYFSLRLKQAYRDSRSRLAALNAFLAESLSGMRIIHLFNRQKIQSEKFDRINGWYADAQVSSVRVFALFQPTITIASGISVTLVIWFGGKEVLAGNLKLGILVAYFTYILSLFQPVREIADKWNTFLSGMTSAERVFSILDWKTEWDRPQELKPARSIPGLKGHIVFENVWFAYQGDDWILRGLNLEIQPGERIGIVGHTGAGKSTLISLLLQFYDPQKGRILLDGKDLREYNKRELRASIGIVQQEVFLFSGDFEDNITFWDKDPTQLDEIHHVLESLGLPRQDTTARLSERGSNFSMGQRQTIAFARALAAKPQIWILDEATANMDSDTESKIQTALETASDKKTAILIAHRLATVQSADRIIVMHHGEIAECGSHSELLKRDGLYTRLFRHQNMNRPEKPAVLQC